MAYTYNRSITVDHTKCGTADSSNFPVLVHLNDSTFKTVGNGGHVQNSNAYDVGFFSDQAGTTPLLWDLFYYDGTNGEIYAFVKQSTLSHTTDNVFYVLYGDAAISTYQSTISSVYVNMTRVMHLNESAHPYHDVTSNAYDSTTTSDPTQVTGKFGKAQSFVGANSQFIGGMTQPNSGSAQTYSGWIKSTTTNNSSIVLDTRVNGSLFNGVLTTSIDKALFYTNNVGPINGPTGFCDGNWHHMVATMNSGTHMELFVDGVSVASIGGCGLINTVGTCRIGADATPTPTAYATAVIQEVRQLAFVASQSWITSDYNNQNSPDTFIAVGTENGGGGSAMPFLCVIT